MMYAYDETLLYKARNTMAWMFDYAVNTLGINLAVFYQMFLASSVSANFGNGDSSTIAGKSGPELVIKIINEFDSDIEIKPYIVKLDRSPEYWLGWALSYYQWLRRESFRRIDDNVPITDMILMYKKYHEMDIEHFVIEIDRRMNESSKESMLKRLRLYAKYSQKDLSDKTDIPVRTIQQYEQGQKSINNAKTDTILKLARALYCEPEDLKN